MVFDETNKLIDVGDIISYMGEEYIAKLNPFGGYVFYNLQNDGILTYQHFKISGNQLPVKIIRRRKSK